MVVGCAFAKPNTTITSIRLPASAKIGIEAGIASYNLTSLASFVALEGSPYINGAHEIKLAHADDIEDRGVLDVHDPFVPDRRDRIPNRLRQRDFHQGLEGAQA